MKSIVVATDMSPRSDRALERALFLATERGARLHVVSVVDDALPEDMVDQLRESVTERLQAYLSRQPGTDQATVTVLAGDPVEQVNAFAIDKEADLLVMGLHRARRVFDQLRETTSERIAAASLAPVLIARNMVEGDYTTALALVSFSDACAAALRAASIVAPKAGMTSFHAMLVPFAGLTGESHVSEMAQAVRRETEAKRDAWLAKSAVPGAYPLPEIVTGSVTQALHDKIASITPDLLVLGTHTRSLALHRLGGFAADLLREPPTDLLLSPPSVR